MAKARVKGFGSKDNREPKGRAWLGHEAKDFREEHDTYGDHEHMQTHRELTKDGEIRVGSEYGRGREYEDRERSAFDQHIQPYEERFQHKPENAGVILGARGGASDSDWEGQDVKFSRNKFMERGARGGAERPWKPKGRAQAEKVSADVK